MATIHVSDGSLLVRLNPLEVLMARRVRVSVPLSAVESIEVVDDPIVSGGATSPLMSEVKMGFAASTAPNRGLATVGPKARYRDGRAFIVVWRNGPSVVVRLAPNETPWRLLVVSQHDPGRSAVAIRSAMPR